MVNIFVWWNFLALLKIDILLDVNLKKDKLPILPNKLYYSLPKKS